MLTFDKMDFLEIYSHNVAPEIIQAFMLLRESKLFSGSDDEGWSVSVSWTVELTLTL